jgi:hypothetical protein
VELIIQFLKDNGTKIVGYLTTAAAFFAFADPTLVADLLGGKWQRWALLISGLLTAMRGHQSTASEREAAVDRLVAKVSPIPPGDKQ